MATYKEQCIEVVETAQRGRELFGEYLRSLRGDNDLAIMVVWQGYPEDYVPYIYNLCRELEEAKTNPAAISAVELVQIINIYAADADALIYEYEGLILSFLY